MFHSYCVFLPLSTTCSIFLKIKFRCKHIEWLSRFLQLRNPVQQLFPSKLLFIICIWDLIYFLDQLSVHYVTRFLSGIHPYYQNPKQKFPPSLYILFSDYLLYRNMSSGASLLASLCLATVTCILIVSCLFLKC